MAAAPLLLDAASTPTLNHYSDYGVVEQSGSANNGKLSIGNDPFGYSDEYTDNESGLQYLQVRYYDPAIMRFTAMDTYPLLNRYAYANENPIMNDAPTGHSAVGAGSSSTGVKGWEGSLIGMGVGGGIGLIGGVLSIVTEGASLYAAFAVETLIGGASGAGGQEAQTAAEHEKANGLQLGIAAGMGAAMAAATFGLGRLFSTCFKPVAGADIEPISNPTADYIRNQGTYLGHGAAGQVYRLDDGFAYKIYFRNDTSLMIKESENWNLYYSQAHYNGNFQLSNYTAITYTDASGNNIMRTPFINAERITANNLSNTDYNIFRDDFEKTMGGRYMQDFMNDGNIRIWTSSAGQKYILPIDLDLEDIPPDAEKESNSLYQMWCNGYDNFSSLWDS